MLMECVAMLLQCCYVALLDLLRMCAMLLQYFAGFVDNVLLVATVLHTVAGLVGIGLSLPTKDKHHP